MLTDKDCMGKNLMPTFRPIHMIMSSLITISLLTASCVENQGVRSKASKSATSLSNKVSGKTSGSGSLPNGGTIDTSATTLQSVKVELSHLVDPFDGTYKKKVTIPKNFSGNFYIAGLNIAALSGKLTKVRFSFGHDKQAIVLNATVGRAPGIIPQTDIQVLMVDMLSKPFNKMRLGYDLYDYNDYSDTSKEPVTDPKNGMLYCRGLQLVDDPTFNSATSTTGMCSGVADKCLYAYAKVTDATLYASTVIDSVTQWVTSTPSRPQVWSISTTGSRSPSYTTSLATMCLPDSGSANSVNEMFNLSLTPGLVNFDQEVVTGLKYRGPYRAINTGGWVIRNAAIFNTSGYGLFETPLVTSFADADPYSFVGYKSNLFPKSGKLSLNQDVRYLGSATRFGERTTEVANSTGTSTFVDGCNIRAQNYDVATTESISSCNVTGTIEVFYVKEDGTEVNITTDKSIKLQLIRASLTNSEGKEVLNSAFKRCDSSSVCGSDECCYNSRCWSKELVTQCVDQTPVIGNQPIGDNCTSDFECSSLCCNQATGSCAPHDPNNTIAPAFCAKTAGQQCISKEFCKPEFVATCKIVKLPTPNPDGTAACTLRCPAVETYGECKAGVCLPPAVPAVPIFNPADCSQAVDP